MVALSYEAKTNLNRLMNEAVATGKLPGAVFAVATIEQELYHNQVGYKTIQGPSSGKLDENSVYWICSMTKLVVTLAALQLIERGSISLDTPVSSIIPELFSPTGTTIIADDLLSSDSSSSSPSKTPVLVRHLLNHTSGVSYAEPKTNPDFLGVGYRKEGYGEDHSTQKLFEILKKSYPSIPLAFEPGTDWAYGWNCELLLVIVERISGQSMEEYLKQYIFSPLGLNITFFLTPEVKSRLVPLTFRRSSDGQLEEWAGQLPIIEQDPSKIDQTLGGIGLYSTVKDYLTLLQHILAIQAGRINTGIITASTASSLFRPSAPPHNAPSSIEQFTGWKDCQFGYGLCVNQTDWEGGRRKGSGFWYGWAGTYYFMDPTSGIAVVYGTQVVPTRDPEVEKLWGKLEKALYAGLIAA